MRITIPKEREREIAPAGSHDATCYCCVDLGTQNTPYGAKRQLYLAWELPDEVNSQGKPFLIGKFYNLTGDARAVVRCVRILRAGLVMSSTRPSSKSLT
jgi:hypothetical protein